ncbi:hypothetical protein MMYC01_207061 [Madurella mycetomatis]|uniref:PXA domain-containing protein n=1 Tax=Madurella mycetomatis TaxID=100816 RepID=A0A175VYM2_9PEZI|nr:hypothetical protein MMYC01_207061 [Madurella mycetomatis]
MTLLSYGIHTFVLDAANLPPLLRSVRGALFPNNTAANNRKPVLVPPSSDAELRALKRRCASSLWGLVPRGVGSVFFAAGGGGCGGHGSHGVVGRLLLLLLPPRLRRVKAVPRASPPASPDLKVQESGKEQGSAPLSKLRADNGRDNSMSAAKARGGLGHMEKEGKEEPGETAALAGSAGSGSGRSGRSAPAPSPPSPPSPPPPPPPPPPFSSSSSDLNDDKGRGRGAVDLIVANTGNASAGKASGAGGQEVDEEAKMILDEIERSVLDVFSDAYCNKHLVYSMLELVLVRLVPELTEKGVVELLGERIPLSPPPPAAAGVRVDGL